MTDEQTQPTTSTAVFPERQIREAFTSWDDQKTIQGQWSSWDEGRRAEFGRLVEDTDPAELSGRVAAFLDSSSDGAGAPTGQTGQPPAPAGAGGSGPGAGGSGSSNAGTNGEQTNAGDGPSDAELAAALDTIETAEDYVDEHPDHIEALLAAEQRAEKPRKTLIDSLERAQRRRDRAKDAAGE